MLLPILFVNWGVAICTACAITFPLANNSCVYWCVVSILFSVADPLYPHHHLLINSTFKKKMQFTVHTQKKKITRGCQKKDKNKMTVLKKITVQQKSQ